MGPPSLSGAGVRRGLRFAGALSVRAGPCRPAVQTGLVEQTPIKNVPHVETNPDGSNTKRTGAAHASIG